MLSRGISRAATAAPRGVRAFAASASQQKVPALADIKPDGVADFKTKQKQFREQLIQAEKRREEGATRPDMVSASVCSVLPIITANSRLHEQSTVPGSLQKQRRRTSPIDRRA